MHWWPRQTPRIGVVAAKRRTTSVEMPALLRRGGVVAAYDGLFPQLAHVAGEVVNEGVVVVDEQDHEAPASAAITPAALSSVSRYSCSGSESATIPPPT